MRRPGSRGALPGNSGVSPELGRNGRGEANSTEPQPVGVGEEISGEIAPISRAVSPGWDGRGPLALGTSSEDLRSAYSLRVCGCGGLAKGGARPDETSGLPGLRERFPDIPSNPLPMLLPVFASSRESNAKYFARSREGAKIGESNTMRWM